MEKITLAQAQAAKADIRAARAAIKEAEELIGSFNPQHVRDKYGFGVGDIIQYKDYRGQAQRGMVYRFKFSSGEIAPPWFTVEVHPLKKDGTVSRLRSSFSFSDYKGAPVTEVTLITPATPAQ